ncbi:MAG: translesion error-prone DNA polymerase V subunit UmuC [Moraxellaceae bacterium]|jgi:DNA polymerase V|uniref:Translesion error-prone DNA polymerase V subunit UmuC n=1 Tax=Aeromonas media TaxID=651 RepID=A0AAE6SPL4_AERME|nr:MULTISPECIES: translesion error-prone DNA polymerase V subunit UmuC [Aeromonas]MBP8852854.1 translesion error-prone DNA polymerase V subunit UmuC [Moraxellaceae bacterium]QHQ53588.1 translesion error-prone DNA polymerase V subunit UmuC [Aeromonas media]QQQ15999.1 translesion error-prone DNA polymerase V subunit UmuC [Aeromonas media]
MSYVYGLVDINNAYCSCETLFDPKLKGRPLVVLSSSQGCIVARSPEAKALGLKMSTPYFQVKDFFEANGGVWRPSNFALYLDLTQRFEDIIADMVPHYSRYSIDECFIWLPSCVGDTIAYGQQIRNRIAKFIGLGVGIGFGPTRTLSKLANLKAKSTPSTGGVVDLSDTEQRREFMAITPVSEVWGIGRQLTAKLEAQGIMTAADLAAADPKTLQRRYGVVVERTAQELNGIPCLGLEDQIRAKQQIIVSRTFGERITDRVAMKQAISNFMEQAAQKLRAERQCARHISLHIATSRFGNQPYYANQTSTRLVVPTNDTRALLGLISPLLDGIWQEGHRYSKAGVMLTDFSSVEHQQGDLFAAEPQDPRRAALMQVVDSINSKGRFGKLFFGATGGLKHDWDVKRESLSPRYTTNLADLPKART